MARKYSDESFRKAFGKKLKNLRKMKEMTQMELARELGFTSTGSISQVEQGYKGLKVESIIRAARALDVHPIILLVPYNIDQECVQIVSSLIKIYEKPPEQRIDIKPCLKEILKLMRKMRPEILDK